MPKPKQIPTESLPIYTWTPDDPSQPHVAFIGNLPMVFRGPDSATARQTADDWRREEMAKHARKEANAKAAGERLKAMHAEKSAAKGGN